MKPKKKSKKSQKKSAVLLPEGGSRDIAAAKIANVVVKSMSAGGPITDFGKGALDVILNPCGEHSSTINSRFPDGTLSQSGILRLRQFDTITPPWSTVSASSNVTNNWSLIGISPPCFKTICVLVAISDNSQPTAAQWRQIFDSLNTALEPAVFPAWDPVAAAGKISTAADAPYKLYTTVYQYSSADLQVDVATGTSNTVEAYRVVGDGFVVLHNTPSLWDQGSFACGQFDSDYRVVGDADTSIPCSVTIKTTNYGGGDPRWTFTVRTGTGFELGSTSTPADGTQSTIMGNAEGGNDYSLLVPTGADSGRPFFQWNNDVLPPPDPNFPNQRRLYVTRSTTTAGLWTVTQRPNNSSIPWPVMQFTWNVQPDAVYTYGFPGSGSGLLETQKTQSKFVVESPNLNQGDVVQADPRFSAELMKNHEGFYMVRRYFEPKLLMTEVGSTTRIAFQYPGMDKFAVSSSTGAIVEDSLDRNGATMVFNIRGISYAANPTIKSRRYIEYLPGVASSLAPFVEETPPKDEDAEEVFRQMQLEGPHSYIPDANLLGLLSGLINSVVENIPLFIRGAKSFSKAVTSALDWAETNIFPSV